MNPSATTRLGGIWAILLAICLNPWLVAYLLTADGHFESEKITWILGLIALALFFTGSLGLAQVIRVPARLSKIWLLLASVSLAFYLTVITDRIIGRLFLPPSQNLIFPANSAVKYVTPEFKVTARINALGFRGQELTLQKKGKFRIIVIGDSFTFGWGVRNQDTWLKQLELKFKKIYPSLEILNLGRSGASPATYEAIASRVVPVLQPDLVIIALLQGNDLQQLLPPAAPGNFTAPRRPADWRRAVNIFTANAYPNLLRLLAITAFQTEVKPIWQEQAAFITQHLTPSQRVRYQNLSPMARQRFLKGQLNPDLIAGFLQDPELYLRLRATHSPGVQMAQKHLGQHLENIRSITTRHHAHLLTITVPNKYFLCEQSMREHTALGAAIDPSLISRNIPDSLTAAVTQKLGIAFYSVTPAMQTFCPTHKLYYTYDSHFTPLGNKVFAAALFRKLHKPVMALISKQK